MESHSPFSLSLSSVAEILKAPRFFTLMVVLSFEPLICFIVLDDFTKSSEFSDTTTTTSASLALLGLGQFSNGKTKPEQGQASKVRMEDSIKLLYTPI